MRFDDQPTLEGPDNSINQISPAKVTKVSASSISVEIQTVGMQSPNTIIQYRVTYQRLVNKKTPVGSEATAVSGSNPVVISNLVQNGFYRITTQAISASGSGNKVTRYYLLDATQSTLSKIGTPKQVGQIKDAKSYLKITGGTTTDDKFSLAYRTFSSLQLPSFTVVPNRGAGFFMRDAKDYNVGYFSFGTSILMPSLITGYEAQGAGLGFFVDPEKGNGYYITIETTGTSANSSSKPIKIFKLDSKQMIPLETSQKGNSSTLDSVFGGRTYNIDVRVKIEDFTVNIIAYINGFKITASDTTALSSANTILSPTNKIGLVGVSGTSMFDYVYAYNITADQYDSSTSLDFYKGQFAKEFLNHSYGDMIYSAAYEDSARDINSKEESFDEFGTVVREIARRTVKFPSRPSVPITFTTGANNLAQILSQSYSNFGGEVFVLNNSSVTIPLSDQSVNELSIMGYTIGFSGDIEYSTDPVAENASKEPVTFESQWLHYESDVQKLAEWIRGGILNKAKIIEMEVFGNPIISVGDIITVDYDYQGFDGTEKIIVVKISQEYNGGLSTKIVGRTI